MARIEGKAGIGYLNRIRETMHPKEHSFSNILLVDTMVAIGAAFLERLSEEEKLSELRSIPIAPSGFPELASWMVSIKHALAIFEDERKTRAKSYLPIHKAFINADPAAIMETLKRHSAGVSGDNLLFATIQNLSKDQLDYLSKYAATTNGSLKEFPIQEQPDQYPGLLIATNTENPFQRGSKYEKSTIPQQAGLRYFDYVAADTYEETRKDDKQQMPVLFYFPIGENGLISFWYAVDKYTFIDSNHYHNRGDTYRYSDLRINVESDLSRNGSSYDKKNVNFMAMLVNKLTHLRPELKTVLIEFDVMAYDHEKKYLISTKLMDMDQLIAGYIQFFSEVLNGGRVSNGKIQTMGESYVAKLNEIFTSLPDDNIRHMFQIAWAKAIEETEKLAKVIIETPSKTISLASASVALPSRESQGRSLLPSFLRKKKG